MSTVHSDVDSEHVKETLSAAAGRVEGLVERVDAVVNSAAVSAVVGVADMLPDAVAGLLALSAAAERVEGVVERVDAVVNSAAVSAVVGVADMLPSVADAAGQVVAGLLALADRFPLASQCAGVLKDLFALYQVGAVCTDF